MMGNLIPRTWKKTLEDRIRKDSIPNISDNMLSLLNETDLLSAAEAVWRIAQHRPDPDAVLHEALYDALYFAAVGLLLDAPGSPQSKRTRSKWLSIVDALEKVREDRLCFYFPEDRKKLDDAIVEYRKWADDAPKTKARAAGARYALRWMRTAFLEGLGTRCDEAVAVFMFIAFRGTWDAETVRARASEWKS
jgi:hypothetical protein